MTIEIKPTIVNGEQFVTVSQMATMTNRSDQTVYALIKKGNSIRKMKHIKIVGRTLIPLSELEDFPFTNVGKNCQDEPYHYNKDGNIV